MKNDTSKQSYKGKQNEKHETILCDESVTHTFQ